MKDGDAKGDTVSPIHCHLQVHGSFSYVESLEPYSQDVNLTENKNIVAYACLPVNYQA